MTFSEWWDSKEIVDIEDWAFDLIKEAWDAGVFNAEQLISEKSTEHIRAFELYMPE